MNGSSAADRYDRQAKLVTAMVYVLPHEPSLAWFFVSQSRPRSRAAWLAFADSAGFAAAVRRRARPSH